VDLDLNDEQELFRDTAVKFLGDRWPIASVRRLFGDASGFDRDVWERAAELGWTSLLVPEELGGGCLSGAGVRDLAIIAEEAGRALLAGPLLPTSIVAFALARDPAGQLAKARLPGIAAGHQLAAWAGPARGVRAEAAAGGYLLTGTAGPVQDAQVADYLLVAAGETQFLVPAATPGVAVEPLDGLDLSRRYCRVRFDRAAVPASALVGWSGDESGGRGRSGGGDESGGGGGKAVDAQLALALALQCAETVGAARAAYEMTLRYVRDRKAFGRPIGSYQALKHRLAEMLLWLESAQAVTSAAVAAVEAASAGPASGDGAHDDRASDDRASDDRVSHHGNALAMARTAKAYVADRCPALVRDCLQMHGGIGYTWEHDIHLFLRRVETNAEIYGGTAEQLGALAPVIGF
jgi:alkylation response protein AidB-like acyl-CoA dehydrogenase